MKNSCSNKNVYYVLVFLSIVLIALLAYYLFIVIEPFDDFSPYNNKQANCAMKYDKEDLAKVREEWEKPYNGNNFGYYNAEPMGLPPLTPIKAYPTFNFHPEEGIVAL